MLRVVPFPGSFFASALCFFCLDLRVAEETVVDLEQFDLGGGYRCFRVEKPVCQSLTAPQHDRQPGGALRFRASLPSQVCGASQECELRTIPPAVPP
jgi:hypothetical protein